MIDIPQLPKGYLLFGPRWFSLVGGEMDPVVISHYCRGHSIDHKMVWRTADDKIQGVTILMCEAYYTYWWSSESWRMLLVPYIYGLTFVWPGPFKYGLNLCDALPFFN